MVRALAFSERSDRVINPLTNSLQKRLRLGAGGLSLESKKPRASQAMAGHRDYKVERRGIEPLTSWLQTRPSGWPYSPA
jgi:hypothetical protein